MTVTSQTCSCSRTADGKARTFYLKQRINDAMSEHFPLSKDAGYDYRAEFDDERQTLTIRKDI